MRRVNDFAYQNNSVSEIEDLEDEIRVAIADISENGSIGKPKVDFDNLLLMLEDEYGYEFIGANDRQRCYEFFNDALESDLYVYPQNYSPNPRMILVYNIGVF